MHTHTNTIRAGCVIRSRHRSMHSLLELSGLISVAFTVLSFVVCSCVMTFVCGPFVDFFRTSLTLWLFVVVTLITYDVCGRLWLEGWPDVTSLLSGTSAEFEFLFS